MEICSLSVNVDKKVVLTDISLSLKPGTLHALMGPNGSGKSSLALALMGHPAYQVTHGSVVLHATNLLELSVDKRAKQGLLLLFQQPVAIPGVTVLQFLHEAYKALCNPESTIGDFYAQLIEAMDLLAIDYAFAERSMHEGFSGGQKKKLELLQLVLLQPKVAILDELDSGLDIDALKLVISALSHIRNRQKELCLLIISHYSPLLQELSPDAVHILKEGSLVCSGDASLISLVQEQGYDAIS